MWKWITRLIANLFKPKPPKLLAAPPCPIMVRQIARQRPAAPPPTPVAPIPLVDEFSFKDSIVVIQDELKVSDKQLDETINRLIKEDIPREYRNAIRFGRDAIYLTPMHFSTLHAFNAGKWLLKKKLAKLHIDAKLYKGVKSIVISTSEITNASKVWHQENASVGELNDPKSMWEETELPSLERHNRGR